MLIHYQQKPAHNTELYRKLIRLCIPLVLQSIISLSFGMIDTLMLAKLGENAISASAVANQPVSIFLTAILGLGNGAVVLISQYWGRKDIEKIKDTIAISIKACAVLAFATMIVCLLIPETIVGLFTKDETVRSLACDYLRIVAFVFPFVGFSNMIAATLRGVEKVKITFIASLSTFLLNVILNRILIFGLGSIPAMGVKGAAAATLCARIIGLIIMGIYMLRDKSIKFRLRDFIRRSNVIRPIFFRIGLPIMFNDLLWSLATSVHMAVLGNLSASAVAAISICSVVSNMVLIFVYSVSDGTAVIIGELIGRAEEDKLKTTTRTLQRLFVIIGVIGCLVMLIFRNVIVIPFHVEPETQRIAVQFITTVAVLMLFMAYTAPAMMGILRGGGDTKYTFLMDIGLVWLVAIPAGIIGGYVLHLPFWAVYLLMKVDEPIKAIIISIRINSWRWARRV